MAVDLVAKRQNLAAQVVDLSAKFTDALYALQQLADERSKLQEPFADSDFTGTDLKHLDAATLGTLFDFVIPAFVTTYRDTGNGGRNEQILLQVRR